MGRKKKIHLEILHQKEANGELEDRVEFEEGQEKQFKLNHYHPSRNGNDEYANETMISGFYWRYQSIYYFRGSRGEDGGFTREEVIAIAPQVYKKCQKHLEALDRYEIIEDEFQLVKYKENKFYVCIDSIGQVLPTELANGLVTGKYERTDNPARVKGLKIKKNK